MAVPVAYQFIHMEVYSRKGRGGRSVDFVLAEAARRPDAALHVRQPLPPEPVFGISVEDVRLLHDERASNARTTLSDGKSRAIRRDQNTILTIVASHPADMSALNGDPSLAEDVRHWEALTVLWLREQYGEALVSVVRHVDESHPHLHAYVVPVDPDMKAGRIHPGQAAKAIVVAAGSSDKDGKALNRRGDAAYRAAMRDWQDSYWQHVGMPSGLTRLGPGRRRLTREEWRAEQAQAKSVRLAEQRVEQLQSAGHRHVQAARSSAAAVLSHATADATRLRTEANNQHTAALRLHDEAEVRVRRAQGIVAEARQDSARILLAAQAKGKRLRRIGVLLRSLWDGLGRSRLADRLRREAEAETAKAVNVARQERKRTASEIQRRQAAERARDAAITSARELGRERDSARRRLTALLPDAPPFHHHPRPGRTTP